ncbi:MAG: DNA-binding transcriptional MerR regulator, partial [Alphaproteobacteria bacterium]
APQKDPLSSASGRRGPKSAAAFRTISEVASELDVPQHVLRFWESRFNQVKPLKRGGGRRYYRPEDIELLLTIRALLYRDGYTIKGVQKLLREGGTLGDGEADPAREKGNDTDTGSALSVTPAPPQAAPASGTVLSGRQRREIEAVIGELTELKKLLQD